jgi:hypothetical protein
MLVENMTVSRLIVHEVFQRRDDKSIVPARYGMHLVTLNAAAMDVFRKRVIDAVGNNSKSMEMAIAQSGDGSAIKAAAEIVPAPDSQFVTLSQRFADMLTNVQTRRDLPGGILVVFQGTIGSPAVGFIGLIKAETHSGFRREVTAGGIDVAYLQDLFLTPEAKLYKIGMFIQSRVSAKFPSGWHAFVYDSHMTDCQSRWRRGLFLRAVFRLRHSGKQRFPDTVVLRKYPRIHPPTRRYARKTRRLAYKLVYILESRQHADNRSSIVRGKLPPQRVAR